MADMGIIRRVRLSVDLESAERTSCRFFAPQQLADEVLATGRLDTADQTILADYRSDLQALIDIGPPPGGLSGHHGKRKLAAETLARIGLPQPIANQLTQLQKQAGDSTLLLEFSTTTPELDCLPWELLGSREFGYRGNSNLVIWRYVAQESLQPWPENRIMLAAASPPEQRISPNVDGEFDDIRILLEQSARHDVPQPIQMLHSSNPKFVGTLAESRPNLLHMAMHGDQTSMFFERDDPRDRDLLNRDSENEPFSRQRIVPYEYIAGVIADIGSVRTAVMSVCFSAYSDEDTASFARNLITEGIPSAIGMACSITPAASREFCRELYRGICAGKPIADSYAGAIVSLRRMSSYHECLWSVPMLYGSDNVIPLPTDDYKRFLGEAAQAVMSIDELRRSLSHLSLQLGSRPEDWRVDSTPAAMGLGKVQKRLKYLRDNMTMNRVDSYIWRLEFEVGYTEVERKISLVRAAMSEVGEAVGPRAYSQRSQRFRSAAERLAPELENIRRLVTGEFPVISSVASAS
jgi:hypothetical protein